MRLISCTKCIWLPFGSALKFCAPMLQIAFRSIQASHLLCHGTSLGPTSCFYWASKLLRGTFWAGLQTLKTSEPSAAAFGHGTSLGPTSCFYLARFGQALKPSKPPQQLSKASEPHNPPQQLSVMVPP